MVSSVFKRWAAVLAALSLAAPSGAHAQVGPLGELSQYLPQSGEEGDWRYQKTADSFEVENIGDASAIKYFYIAPVIDAQGKRRIETSVSIHPGSAGGAGLLYGLNQERTHYHMLTLGADGTVSLFRRDPSGFKPMMQTTSSAFLPEKINRLVIEENGNRIRYALNGTSLGSIGGDLFGKGATGLAAVGDVRALFTGFSDAARAPRPQQPNAQPNVLPNASPDQVPSGQAPAQKIQGAGQALALRPIQIVDEAGPGGRLLAYETLIPKDWQTTGGVKWSPQDGPSGCFTGAKLIWGAGTEDESYGIAFLDPLSWGVNSMGPSRYMCQAQDLTNAEMAMRAYFQVISSQIQVEVLEVTRPPEVKALTQTIGQSWINQWRSGATRSNAWADGVLIKARVKSATSENDSYVVAVTTHVETNTGMTTIRDGRTAFILAISTPPGKLDEGHPGFAAIINNLRANPQWQQVEAQWWSQKLAQGRAKLAAGARAAAAASRSTNTSSVGDMMFDSWKRRNAMTDAGQAKSVNSIWEVEPWQTSSGDTVLLNQNYNHAWQLDNGTIVQTNDANFNPMQTFGETGQPMQMGQ